MLKFSPKKWSAKKFHPTDDQLTEYATRLFIYWLFLQLLYWQSTRQTLFTCIYQTITALFLKLSPFLSLFYSLILISAHAILIINKSQDFGWPSFSSSTACFCRTTLAGASFQIILKLSILLLYTSYRRTKIYDVLYNIKHYGNAMPRHLIHVILSSLLLLLRFYFFVSFAGSSPSQKIFKYLFYFLVVLVVVINAGRWTFFVEHGTSAMRSFIYLPKDWLVFSVCSPIAVVAFSPVDIGRVSLDLAYGQGRQARRQSNRWKAIGVLSLSAAPLSIWQFVDSSAIGCSVGIRHVLACPDVRCRTFCLLFLSLNLPLGKHRFFGAGRMLSGVPEDGDSLCLRSFRPSHISGKRSNKTDPHSSKPVNKDNFRTANNASTAPDLATSDHTLLKARLCWGMWWT